MSTRVTRAVTVTSRLVAPLVVALAVLGGIGSFGTVSRLAGPWFGGWAWIVPVGVDVGIVALLAWDLLMEFAGMGWPVLRAVAWGFIAATVVLNVAAAHGVLVAAVMHAAMPALLVTVVEGVRQLIRRRAGLATGSRRDRVPAARWALAPLSSWALWRRMVLWNVTGYRRGLELQYAHLLAVARLQQRYGRRLWRWKAPLAERVALQLQLARMALPGGAQLDPTPATISTTVAGITTMRDAPSPATSANAGWVHAASSHCIGVKIPTWWMSPSTLTVHALAHSTPHKTIPSGTPSVTGG